MGELVTVGLQKIVLSIFANFQLSLGMGLFFRHRIFQIAEVYSFCIFYIFVLVLQDHFRWHLLLNRHAFFLLLVTRNVRFFSLLIWHRNKRSSILERGYTRDSPFEILWLVHYNLNIFF